MEIWADFDNFSLFFFTNLALWHSGNLQRPKIPKQHTGIEVSIILSCCLVLSYLRAYMTIQESSGSTPELASGLESNVRPNFGHLGLVSVIVG